MGTEWTDPASSDASIGIMCRRLVSVEAGSVQIYFLRMPCAATLQ